MHEIRTRQVSFADRESVPYDMEPKERQSNTMIAAKNFTLKYSIVFAFAVFLIALISFIGIIVFSNWSNATAGVIRQMEEDASRDILDKIERFVNMPIYVNQVSYNLLSRELIDLNNKTEREIFFAGIMEANSDIIYSFAFGTENGEYFGARKNNNNEIEIMLSNSQTDWCSNYFSINEDFTAKDLVVELGKFDARTRDWYKIAEEKGKPVFSPIYRHFVMYDLALTASHPVYDKNGNLRGVIGTHFPLSKINEHLEEIALEKQSITYILDRKTEEVVANSLGKQNFTVDADNTMSGIKIDQIENELIIEAYRNYIDGLKGNYTVKNDNDVFHIKSTEYSKMGLDWLIITAIPESQFTGVISESVRRFLILSGITILIGIIFWGQGIKQILKPVYNLIQTTERFTNGEFSSRAQVFKNDEIGKLSQSFNKMADELNVLIFNLEEKVRERTNQLDNTNSQLKLLFKELADYTLELEQLYHQLDEEIDKARQVHERTLPTTLPDVEGISFAAHYQPAQMLGGDFYDVLRKDNKLIFYLSDVSGHGLDGAMLSVFVKHTIISYISFTSADNITPTAILRHLAEQFGRENYPEDLYVTSLMAVLDLDSMELSYCSAGLQEALLVQQGSGERQKLHSKGMFITSYLPLDILNLQDDRITLTPGSTIFCNTDGLTEQGSKGTYYMDRLPDVFFQNAHLPADLVSQAVVDDFRKFNNGSLQGKDDITFLVLQVSAKL